MCVLGVLFFFAFPFPRNAAVGSEDGFFDVYRAVYSV